MTRAKTDIEFVTGAEASRRIGITAQSVGTWATKPDAPVKLEKGKLLYEWPRFPRWREALLLAERKQKPVNFAEAQERRAAAEAEMAEMERDKMREDLIPKQEARQVLRQVATTIRAQLSAVPGRYAPRTVGLKSLPESQQVWEAAIRDILAELQEG